VDKAVLILIAREYGINDDTFSDFMQQRFPNEMDVSYIREWAHRFASGAPMIYMDQASTNIYINIMRGYGVYA
jgi:hypothetical protein